MSNSKQKGILLIIAGLIVLIGGFFVFNDYIYNEKQDSSISQEQREVLVSGYIENNIAALSPEPAVLGGTFYVTNIEFNSGNSGTVEYEDGHIALTADFEYSVNEGEEGIQVTLFNVDEF